MEAGETGWLRRDQGHSVAFLNCGNAKLKLERLDEAIADYDSAIRLNPGFTAPAPGNLSASQRKT